MVAVVDEKELNKLAKQMAGDFKSEKDFESAKMSGAAFQNLCVAVQMSSDSYRF